MKKYFFPILMGIMILFGLLLTFTAPLIEWFFPINSTTFRYAAPDQTQKALAQWLNAPESALQNTQGVQLTTKELKYNWFTFQTPHNFVENFIRQQHLTQKELSSELLQKIFYTPNPPVTWWHPAELKRETYFTESSDKEQLLLIYQAELAKGYLLIKTRNATGLDANF